MNIGIDHGYYAIKTRNCSFPAGITPFGDREPYTRQNVLRFGGCFFVCGSGRQPIQRDKTANDNYFLLTLAARIICRTTNLTSNESLSTRNASKTGCPGYAGASCVFKSSRHMGTTGLRAERVL